MFWKKNVKGEAVDPTQVLEVESKEVAEASKPVMKDTSPVIKNVRFPDKEPVSFGNKNEYIKFAQQNLIARGYEIPGGAEGTYGIATVKAVKKFYGDNGLGLNSGNHIGPKAWNVLFEN